LREIEAERFEDSGRGSDKDLARLKLKNWLEMGSSQFARAVKHHIIANYVQRKAD
jgi:hypothetical protein